MNFRRGTYLEALRLPAGLGTEAAGVVREIVPDVSRWSVGDEVSVAPAFSQHDYPVYAAEAVVPAAALVGRPEGLDAVSSAAVWMPYVTVYGVVAEIVRVRAGDRVGVTSAANSLAPVPIATLPVAAGSSLDHTDALHAGNDKLIVRARIQCSPSAKLS